MKRIIFLIILFLNCGLMSFGACTKPNYVPNNYTVTLCEKYSGDYIESIIVEDNITHKLGAYTYWDDPNDISPTPIDGNATYNKKITDTVYDEIQPVTNGFIVKINNQFGYFHVDKGKMFDVKYDKIYLSNDEKQVCAQIGSKTITKKNPNNKADRMEDLVFNIFIRPMFFWLDDALPKR